MTLISVRAAGEGLANLCQRLHDRGLDPAQGQVAPSGAGNQDDIARRAQAILVKAKRLAQQPPYPIAADGMAAFPADGQTEARARLPIGQSPGHDVPYAEYLSALKGPVKVRRMGHTLGLAQSPVHAVTTPWRIERQTPHPGFVNGL